MMLYLAALLTGLAGSFHCVGMCGPIALALPVAQGSSNAARIFGRVLYNLGRVVTYAVMGALLGSFGLGLKLAGFQQAVSLVAGALMVLFAFTSFGLLERWFRSPFSWISGTRARRLFGDARPGSLLVIGLVNGLLPCGFVYVGLMGSVATQGVWQGALFMACFGLGTFPLMLGVSLAGQFVSTTVRARLRKLTPVLAVCIGTLFILRGLSLGIPYVSPKLSNDHTVVRDCCRKH